MCPGLRRVGGGPLVQELDPPGLDLDDVPVESVLGLEQMALELAVDEDGASLFQAVRAAVRQPVPCDDPDVADFLLPLVVRVAVLPVGGDRKIRDRRPVCRMA